MKIYIFVVLCCVVVLVVSFLPGIPGRNNTHIKLDKQWIDEILEEQGLKRKPNKDYIFTKWESKTRKGWYDFKLDIIDKEINDE
jgi:hypothetical protein